MPLHIPLIFSPCTLVPRHCVLTQGFLNYNKNPLHCFCFSNVKLFSFKQNIYEWISFSFSQQLNQSQSHTAVDYDGEASGGSMQIRTGMQAVILCRSFPPPTKQTTNFLSSSTQLWSASSATLFAAVTVEYWGGRGTQSLSVLWLV